MIRRVLVFFNLIYVFLGVGAFWDLIGKEPFRFVLTDPLTVAQLLAIIAILAKNLLIADICIPVLFFYGTLQLFLGWEGIWLVQANNVLVSLTIIYIIYRNFIRIRLITLMVGFVVGVLLFIPLRLLQKSNPIPSTKPILETGKRDIPLLNTFINQKQVIVRKVRE